MAVGRSTLGAGVSDVLLGTTIGQGDILRNQVAGESEELRKKKQQQMAGQRYGAGLSDLGLNSAGYGGGTGGLAGMNF